MITKADAAGAIDASALEWIKQHFKDLCTGVASTPDGSIDAALKRFDNGAGQMLRVYSAAQELMANKISEAQP